MQFCVINIQSNRKELNGYYDALKGTQSKLDITAWNIYFGHVILDAQTVGKQFVEFTVKKIMYFDSFKELLNERQQKVINRMFEAVVEGVQGGIAAKKYIDFIKTTKITATRDLQHMNEKGALNLFGAGHSILFVLAFKFK